jgi:hypothetical protein
LKVRARGNTDNGKQDTKELISNNGSRKYDIEVCEAFKIKKEFRIIIHY